MTILRRQVPVLLQMPKMPGPPIYGISGNTGTWRQKNQAAWTCVMGEARHRQFVDHLRAMCDEADGAVQVTVHTLVDLAERTGMAAQPRHRLARRGGRARRGGHHSGRHRMSALLSPREPTLTQAVTQAVTQGIDRKPDYIQGGTHVV
jgi:hypothetical protein